MVSNVEQNKKVLSKNLDNTEQTLDGLESVLGLQEGRVDGLPEGWCSATLEDIATWGSGGTPSRANSQYYGGNIPWVKTGDLGPRIVMNASEFITEEAVANSSAKFFPKGSVALAMYGATIGKTSILGIDATTNQACGVGNPIQGATTTNYLYYLLRNEKDAFIAKGKGGAQPNISQTLIKAHETLLPPLAEQTIIAQTLDTLLAQVDNTKTRLDNIPKILKTFRQSVLAAAVSGKLTEAWRGENECEVTDKERLEEIQVYRYQKWQEGQEAKYEAKGKWPKTDDWKKKYVEAELDPDFVKKELPRGWVFQPLDGLVYIGARIGWKGLKASEYTETGPLFLSVHGLNYGQYVNLDRAFHISEERFEESPEIKIVNNDILLCKDGAGIGKIGIVKGLKEKASINSSLLLVRAGKYFVTEYLYYFLAGPIMQQLVQERMTGSAVPHLFQRDVKEFVLEVPPINEQTEIIRRVEELFAFAAQIEQQVKNAQGRVNNLTQSILAKAFRGELTAHWRTQNPELITGDNSAAALLAAIKKEREELKPVKKSSVKKAIRKTVKKKATVSEKKAPSEPLSPDSIASDTQVESVKAKKPKAVVDLASATARQNKQQKVRKVLANNSQAAPSTESPETDLQWWAFIRSHYKKSNPDLTLDELMAHLVQALQIKRLSPQRKALLEQVIKKACKWQVLYKESGVYCLYEVQFADYDNEALDILLPKLLRKGSSIPQDDVYRDFLQGLGFKRGSPKAEERFKNYLRSALRRKLLQREGNQLKRT